MLLDHTHPSNPILRGIAGTVGIAANHHLAWFEQRKYLHPPSGGRAYGQEEIVLAMETETLKV